MQLGHKDGEMNQMILQTQRKTFRFFETWLLKENMKKNKIVSLAF